MKDFLEAVIEHPWAALYVAVLIRIAISGLTDVRYIINNDKK